MSQGQVTSEDHRRAFISSIFFGIMLTEGLTKFVDKFIINIDSRPGFLLGFNDTIQNPSISPLAPNDLVSNLFNLLFFAVTFFWIVCHWIFYHDLITRYPYYRWRKFLVDVTLFSIMVIVLRLSLSVSDNPTIFPLFVSLVTIWYALASLWHFADRGLRPVRSYSDFLVVKSIVYFSILMIFLFVTYYPGNPVTSENKEIVKNGLMSSVVILLLIFNAERLNRFISAKERLSNCCLFYTSNNNEDRTIMDPSSMPYQPSCHESLRAYPPQMYVVELFRRCSEKIDQYGNKTDINIKDRSAEIIELLIYFWLSRVTNFYDTTYCFPKKENPIKRKPIESMIESLSLKDNVFLDILYSNGNIEKNDILNINLPKDITIKRNLQRHEEHTHPSSGTITIRRKDFNLKIKYKESKYRKDLLSPSLILKISKDLEQKIGGVPINPIYMNGEILDRLSNIGWTVYRVELHGDAKLSTRIRSIFQTSAADEIEWLDLMANNFNDFFDIDRHIVRVEKAN